MKTCKKCGVTKALAEFNHDKHKRDGRATWCKRCACAVSADYQRRNKAKCHARKMAWARRNHERLAPIRREQERRRIWLRGPVQYTDAYRARARAYYHKRKERDPSCASKAKLKRLERMGEIIRSGTDADRRAVFQAADGRCVYCLVRSSALALEHIFPVSVGGHDAPYNWAAACKSCNSSKRDALPRDWIIWRLGMAGFVRLLPMIWAAERGHDAAGYTTPCIGPRSRPPIIEREALTCQD